MYAKAGKCYLPGSIAYRLMFFFLVAILKSNFLGASIVPVGVVSWLKLQVH